MENIFDNIKTIAIVGLSDKKDRPSYMVGKYLVDHGFAVVPINPKLSEWEGIRCYPSLSSVPNNVFIDVVDIFRKSEEVMSIVEETLDRGDAHTIWMQEGVVDMEAKDYADSHGLTVYMDNCIMKAHKKDHEEEVV